jgi:hypothetical protein
LYFLETDRVQKTQTLAIRGTADRPNVWQDIEIALVPDRLLSIKLARGFRGDALSVHADVKPYMRKDYSIRVTGHSLGGAVAGIVAGYLIAEGYDVARLATFGAPKFTDRESTKFFERNMMVTRIIHEKDVVPMLPPSGFIFGEYEQIGPEVILREGRHYVYLPSHDADRLSIGDFWRNITDFSSKEHHMVGYLSNIEEKVETGAHQVPYFGHVNSSGRGTTESGIRISSAQGVR